MIQSKLATAVRQQLNLEISGPKAPGYEIFRSAIAVGGGGGLKVSVASIVNHKWTRYSAASS